MTEFNLKPGWYIATDQDGTTQCCIWRASGEWHCADWDYTIGMPPGWVIGPRIEDLLRDAARYRWLLKQTVISGTELYDLYAACNWEPAEGQIDALIDAEITREAGETKP